jgi:hypothetical protein
MDSMIQTEDGRYVSKIYGVKNVHLVQAWKRLQKLTGISSEKYRVNTIRSALKLKHVDGCVLTDPFLCVIFLVHCFEIPVRKLFPIIFIFCSKNSCECIRCVRALITNICDIMLGAMHAILFCFSFISCRSKKSAGESKTHTVRIGNCIVYGKSRYAMFSIHSLEDKVFLVYHVNAFC